MPKIDTDLARDYGNWYNNIGIISLQREAIRRKVDPLPLQISIPYVEKCVNYLVKNHFPELKERYFYFRFGMPYSQSDASSQSPATFMNLAMKRHYGIELRGDLEYAEQDVVKGVLAQQLSGILLSETPSKDAAKQIDDIASERGCKKYIDAAILYERKISKNGKKD